MMSLKNMKSTIGEHQPTGFIILVHKRQIVGCDDDSGARFMEFDKETQNASRHCWIDIAGWFIRQQKFWT